MLAPCSVSRKVGGARAAVAAQPGLHTPAGVWCGQHHGAHWHRGESRAIAADKVRDRQQELQKLQTLSIKPMQA